MRTLQHRQEITELLQNVQQLYGLSWTEINPRAHTDARVTNRVASESHTLTGISITGHLLEGGERVDHFLGGVYAVTGQTHNLIFLLFLET